MPANKPTRPKTKPQLAPIKAGGDAVGRALQDLQQAVVTLQREAARRVSLEHDLEVGSNRIVHNLGRRPVGIHVTPMVADASWAWAVTARDEQALTITTVGIAQPGALIEVW